MPLVSKQNRCHFLLLKRIWQHCRLLLISGSIYLLWLKTTGLSLHCPFYWLTGLYCPGCGITTMFICLTDGDLVSAWKANPAIILAAPFIIVQMLKHKSTDCPPALTRPNQIDYLTIALLIWFVSFGILRNL